MPVSIFSRMWSLKINQNISDYHLTKISKTFVFPQYQDATAEEEGEFDEEEEGDEA